MTAASTRARCGSDEDYQPSVLPTDSAEDPNLNRQKLLEARTQIAVRVLDAIHGHNSDPDSPHAGILRRELRAKFSGEYGSLIEWLVLGFLND